MKHYSGSAADALESLCHRVTSPFGKGRRPFSLRRFHQLTSAPWADPSQGRSLVQSHFHVLGAELLGFQLRLRRESLASFPGKEVAAQQTEVS